MFFSSNWIQADSKKMQKLFDLEQNSQKLCEWMKRMPTSLVKTIHLFDLKYNESKTNFSAVNTSSHSCVTCFKLYTITSDLIKQISANSYANWFKIQTHFLTNGKNGKNIFVTIDGAISANKRMPVDGASQTLFRMLVTSSAAPLDGTSTPCWNDWQRCK